MQTWFDSDFTITQSDIDNGFYVYYNNDSSTWFILWNKGDDIAFIVNGAGIRNNLGYSIEETKTYWIKNNVQFNVGFYYNKDAGTSWMLDVTYIKIEYDESTNEMFIKFYDEEPQTNITLDLSTIGLPAGTHSIQIKLSDDGVTKADSELSNAVQYVVAPLLNYTITPTLTNVTGDSSNPTTIQYGSTATLHFTANSGYNLPDSVTVTGATSSWDKTTGTLTLSNPTGNVTVTIVGVSVVPMPTKGDVITMNLDGTDRQYRVLSVNGTNAEVMSMFDVTTSCVFNSNNGGSNVYNGGELDVYLNTTWYGGLTNTAKGAIVPKTITQYQYAYNSSVYNEDTHASYANYSTKSVKESGLTRNVYAIDIEDIETYFNGTFSNADVWEFFWNTRVIPISPYNCWLRSADAGDSIIAWDVNSDYGYMSHGNAGSSLAARSTLTIDLSKITWNN